MMLMHDAHGQKHKPRDIKVREMAFSVKELKEDGTFSGYGSVFGEVDSYQEVVERGAFAECLNERGDLPFPILWQHKSSEPIGLWTSVAEDDYGLRLDGKLLIEDVSRAKEAYALLKARVVSGLSIGYWVRNSSFDEKTGIRYLKKLDLEEVSIVTFPANGRARVDAVKFKLAHGGLPSMKEFEDILREAGFSKSRAACVANKGYAELIRRESGSDEGDDALAKKLAEIAREAGALKLPVIG